MIDHDLPPELSDGEYAVLRLPDAWHVLSLTLFLAAVGARFLVALLPPELHPMPKPILSAFTVPALASLGLLAAVVGLRRPESRGAAKIGLLLNGIVLLLSALALAAFFYILPD